MAEVQLVLVSHTHWFTGTVETGNERVLEFLNNASTDYIRLQDVAIYRDGLTGKSWSTTPLAVLPKGGVSFVLLGQRPHENPGKLLHSFVHKLPFDALVTVANYEMSGRLYMKPNTDPLSALLRDSSRFFPLTQVSLNCPQQRTLNAPVVLVSKEALTSFAARPAPTRTAKAPDLVSDADSALAANTPATGD